MPLSDFNYTLPDELIARYPTAERRASRMLVVAADIEDRSFAELPGLLGPGDLLVFNDTRVIRARLRGRKQTGGKVELLAERLLPDDIVLAQLRASKSPQPSSVLEFPGECRATVIGRRDDMYLLRFSTSPAQYLERFGEMPLPPYLGRDAEIADDERYQTVFAKHAGAVAAPTAGLHFDQAMLDETARAGVRHAFVTLHVGAGTFAPLRESAIEANRLHSERVIVSDDVARAVRETRSGGGRVFAVGTTAVRALEAASQGGSIAAFDGETSLFIRPGYAFRSIDALLTNFHLPQSSLLMLVAAFAGRQRILEAYAHAVRERYRFFSYGDAMLLLSGKR